MRPIGLTVKRVWKKYGEEDGELMIIHQCEGCGKISINRIASDDNEQLLLAVFQDSKKLDEQTLGKLDADGIRFLQPIDLDMVKRQLFGKAT